MLSRTFFKMTNLLSVFIFLSSNPMEHQKRSMDDVYAKVRDNLDHYGDIYKSDLTELRTSIRTNAFAQTIAILEQMADNMPHYTQQDKNSLLSLVQTYAQELYHNELIGFNAIGTLAKHKKVLCYINAQCTLTLNPKNEINPQDTEEFQFTKKSCSPTQKNSSVEKKQTLEPIDTFTSYLQTNIDTIRHARIIAHFWEDNTTIGDKTVINKSIKQWFAEFVVSIKEALAKKDEDLLNQLWRANFNDNALQFKKREEALKDGVIEALKKDNIDEASIEWFTNQATKFVYAKEIKPTLKSKTKQQVAIPVKPISAPQVNPLPQRITGALTRLNNATELDVVMALLEEFSAILNSQDRTTLKATDITAIQFHIEEAIGRIYQNCLLGLYGNHEQKLQLHIFDTCTDALIAFDTQLRKQLKESDKVIDTYVNTANKRKQACLYEIKVIRDAEKIATQEDVKVWESVIKDRLSSALEGQNAPAIQKTIQANFDANKTPLLAEQYDNIVPDIYNQKNTGTTWTVWLEKNKQIFEKPRGQMGEMPQQPLPTNSILQACKNHWILSSLTLTAVVAGIYYAWQQCYGKDEEDDEQPIQKEEPKKETAEESTASDQKKAKVKTS